MFHKSIFLGIFENVLSGFTKKMEVIFNRFQDDEVKRSFPFK